MTIEEAKIILKERTKTKVLSVDPFYATQLAIQKLLDYTRYLEINYAKLKETSEVHRQQVGDLYRKIDER